MPDVGRNGLDQPEPLREVHGEKVCRRIADTNGGTEMPTNAPVVAMVSNFEYWRRAERMPIPDRPRCRSTLAKSAEHERVGQRVLQLGPHRPAALDRAAPVAGDEVAEPADVLLDDRAVEAVDAPCTAAIFAADARGLRRR